MRPYRTVFKVKPTKNHPRFFDWDFGLLSIWLFADSGDEAIERAETIIAALPYEIFGAGKYWTCKTTPDKKQILIGTDEPMNSRESQHLERVALEASLVFEFGIAFLLEAAETGAEEPGIAYR